MILAWDDKTLTTKKGDRGNGVEGGGGWRGWEGEGRGRGEGEGRARGP